MAVHNSIAGIIREHGVANVVFNNKDSVLPQGDFFISEERHKFVENYKISLKRADGYIEHYYISDLEVLLESKSILMKINGVPYEYHRYIAEPHENSETSIIWGFDQDGSFGFLQDGVFMAFHKWSNPVKCNPEETIFTPLTDANAKTLWHRVCTAVQEFKIEENIQ